MRGLLARAHPNVVVVALAAKLARIAWAVLRQGRNFDHQAAGNRHAGLISDSGRPSAEVAHEVCGGE